MRLLYFVIAFGKASSYIIQVFHDLKGIAMKLKPALITILGVVLLSSFLCPMVSAQGNNRVKEPPVPVYVITPFHDDSLVSADEGSIHATNSTWASADKKLDTLQQQIQKSSAESTAHFIWLYTLVALLGIMDIVLLFSVSRIRKELAQMKRFEHHKMLLTSESSAIPQPVSIIQETPWNEVPEKKPAPVRKRKPRISKPRVKKQK
ncbi:MAG: hypothetical protein EHM64_05125 [Ignavibacteriae bacterium]|nr:MAG: hypothetical protein EHM64_05125 [Ignavibacteriota bacterium]